MPAPALATRTMTIDALLYLDAELAVDDLASLARDWRRWQGARRVRIAVLPVTAR